jgi:hypothetical protein
MARTLVGFLALAACAALLLPVALATGLAILFAAAVRGLGRAMESRFVPWPDLMMFDAALGWRPRPGLDTHYLAELDDVFRVVTDREGWPGHGSVEASEAVVIGDSFAFGYGVDTHKSFAEITPGLRVKGVGAPGYSMVQGVLLMEQSGSSSRKTICRTTFGPRCGRIARRSRGAHTGVPTGTSRARTFNLPAGAAPTSIRNVSLRACSSTDRLRTARIPRASSSSIAATRRASVRAPGWSS